MGTSVSETERLTVHGTLRLPAHVRYGLGASRALPEIGARLGTTVAVVTEPHFRSTEQFRHIERELERLGRVEIVDVLHPELPVEQLEETAGVVARLDPDYIVGFGGGSVLDAAKIISLLVSHGGPLNHYYGENKVPGPVIPIVAVPTTAGTGSEVTPVAVVKDAELGTKVGVSAPELIPRVALVDPDLTFTCPPSVTAYAGIDALVHAFESYTARAMPLAIGATSPVFAGRNVLAEPYSLAAARRLLRYLPDAVRDGSDVRAREEVALASLEAGIAFGSTGTHIAHALQYPIGALTGTPHGLGTGMLLPYVAVALSGAAHRRLETFADAVVPGRGISGLVDEFTSLTSSIGIPPSLEAIGITADQLPGIARTAMGAQRLIGIAPIDVDDAYLCRLLEAALRGEPRLVPPWTEQEQREDDR